VAADDNDDEEEEEEDEDEEAVDAAALRSEDGEGDKKEELELGPTAAAADGGLMQLSKADALLEYQGTFGSIGRPARMSGLMDASVKCVTRRHMDCLNRSVPCIARWMPSIVCVF